MPEEASLIPEPAGTSEDGSRPSRPPGEVLQDLKNLGPTERGKVLASLQREDRSLAVSQVVEASMWQGPLPSPDQLEHFNRVVPSAAERLIRMAEKQQDHRLELEQLAVRSQTAQSARGQLFALVMCLAILTVGGFAIYRGYAVSAATIICSTIIGMGYVFVSGRKREENSRQAKQEAIEQSEADQAGPSQSPAGPAGEI